MTNMIKDFVGITIFTVAMVFAATAFAGDVNKQNCKYTLQVLGAQYQDNAVEQSHWSDAAAKGYRKVTEYDYNGKPVVALLEVNGKEASNKALHYARMMDQIYNDIESAFEICSSVYSVRKMNSITFWASGGTFKGL